MQAFTENFQHLIDCVIAHPQQAVGTLDFVSARDKHQQLHEWNKTGRPRDTQGLIAGLFETQAIKTPDAIAVRYKNRQLSYQKLNEQANQLAHFLIAKGIQPGTLLGVFLERSLQLPVTLLAILKAGAVYVPLDLSFPEERLNTIVRDARLQWVITSRYLSLWKFPAALQVIDIEQSSQWLALDNHTPAITPAGSKPLLNVIYTSGSSGQPKGVMVSQAAIVNRLLWMQESFPLQAHDRVLHKTPYSFDVSVWEIFWPLITGAQLIIAEPQGHKNPAYLRDIIHREKISILHFVPSMLSVFLQTDAPGKCASLKEVFCSGEVLSLALAKHFYTQLPNATLVNLYGPTEAAIDVSCYTCSKESLNVPIGKAISNTQLYVLDQKQNLLPIGAVGEITIGGAGLAEGYIHQTELTAQAFIDNPFQPGTRLYKTGDLGRFDHEGQLHFIGRADQQIKVRGFRVEPGEIESQLNRHPAIRETLIVANALDNNDHQIIAYYIAKAAVDASSLRHYLTALLPSFMIPNAFVEMTAWPLTNNGKIDRNALPNPDRESLHTQPFVPPRNSLEESIARIWSELLNIERIGIYDNFFELGGHSLLATLAITRMQNTFNVKIPLSQIFREPTVANFAQAILLAQQTQSLLINAGKSGSDNNEDITP
jgi:amino acid adenylation domain-containing protein